MQIYRECNVHDIHTIKEFQPLFYYFDFLDAHFTHMLIQHMPNTWKVVANLYMEQ